jgi:hypothetical protein
MLTFFTHGVSIQRRPTSFYKAHRIATGMGVDTMEKVLH